jgi:hypothetical protein
VKVQAHFPAESANFGADGTFTVFKGGITDINASGWPAPARVAIVTRLELTIEEAQELVELTLRLSFEGRELALIRQPLAVKADPSKPIYVNSIAELNIGVPGPGRITIEAAVNEMGLPLIHLQAIQIGAPAG